MLWTSTAARLERDFQANVLAGVSLPDLSLIAFYRIARDAMQAAGVDKITALTGHEKALLGCMALAFDLTHRLLAHASDTGVHMDMMTRRPQVETETGLFPTLAAVLPGHPLPVADLPFGATPHPGHWPANAALPASWPSVFDTSLAFHRSWNGPTPDFPPEHANQLRASLI